MRVQAKRKIKTKVKENTENNMNSETVKCGVI